MKTANFLLIFSTLILKFSSSQSIFCNFYTNEVTKDYRCDMTLINPSGFDEFTKIDGVHESGKNDDDVTHVYLADGTDIQLLIPRIICDTFTNLQVLQSYLNKGFENLTENAIKKCTKLATFRSYYVNFNQIHPNFFLHNVELRNVDLRNRIYSNISTIPETLFNSLTKLSGLELTNSPSIFDLPLNIFKNLNLLTFLDLSTNSLNFWHLEWTKSLTNLNHFYIYNNKNILNIPRNALNSKSLKTLWIDKNSFKELDYFYFNENSVEYLYVANTPIERIDFNLIDRMKNLRTFHVSNCTCIDKNFNNFHQNRQTFMAELEPCFLNFDRRILSEN